MAATRYDVLIVGAGHGGAQAAIVLRRHGYAGSIAIVGAEPEPPYERPPLSKDYLAGEKTFERILIRPPAFWEERDVELRLGDGVASVDPDAREVTLASGERLGYGAMVWAAGGRPRRLRCEGAGNARLHHVRSRADVDRIRAELPGVERVAVIGGGYIGLEAAAVLNKLRKQVALIEATERVLVRVAGEPISHFYEAEHRAHGVEVRTQAAVDAIVARPDGAIGIRLAGGDELRAGTVIVGIGIDAAVEPLLAAGAAGANGVDVDQFCRTSLAGIYAVGDCAAHENRFAGGARVRLESVQNASDQATIAAKAIAGAPEPYSTVPWFWSNQYDLKLQTVGLSHGHDDFVVRGDPASRSFSVVYLRGGQVVALDCVNAVKDYVQGRALVVQQARVPASALADASVPLKRWAG